MVRILGVVDAYTWECLNLEADTSVGSGRITRVLEPLIGEGDRPQTVRSNNGPEFTRAGCWPGRRTGRSAWFTSSRAGGWRTATWRVSTAGCGIGA